MTKKILFICNDSGFFISHRLNLAVLLHQEGYKVYLATPKNSNPELLRKFNIIYKKIYLIRSSTNIFKEILSFYSLLKLIISDSYNILHFITTKPVLYGGVISRLLGKKNIVFSITGLGYLFSENINDNKFLRTLAKFLYKISLNRSNSRYIFQNNKDLNSIKKIINIDTKNLIIIKGSGVDTNIFKPTNKKNNLDFKVLMAGRLLKNKGVYEYLEASKIVKKRGFNIEFLLAGSVDDNPNSISNEELNNIKKSKDLNFLGLQKNIFQVLENVNIAVLPSYYGEGMPRFLLEAASCGKAIVTTNIVGCRDCIINNETGILVPPKNAKSIADAIIELYRDKIKLEKFSNNARLYALDNFDIKSVTEKHLKIYNSFNND